MKRIAIVSGKGGVGKSTIAFHLAHALSQHHKVGLLDADVYGPSMPYMMQCQEQPQITNGMITPLQHDQLVFMSIGLLCPPEVAAVWRGPMVHKALKQIVHGVAWGELDYMIIDTPPGTGDVHLTLAEIAKPDAAIIVTTPQELALLDVRKACNMLQKMDIPILGLIENMSYHQCAQCTFVSHPFDQGGGQRECEKSGIRFLGAIPMPFDNTVLARLAMDLSSL